MNQFTNGSRICNYSNPIQLCCCVLYFISLVASVYHRTKFNKMSELCSWKISTRQGKGNVCGKNAEIIITEFRNKFFVIISDCGKVGSLIHIDYQTPDFHSPEDKLPSARTIFGKDEPEIQAVALTLAENFFHKSVLFGFSLKEYNQSCVKDLKLLISNLLLVNP